MNHGENSTIQLPALLDKPVESKPGETLSPTPSLPNEVESRAIAEDLRRTPTIQTFSRINELGCIEIRDALTGNVIAIQKSLDDIYQTYPDKFIEHVLPDGRTILLEKGLTPDTALKKSMWRPFSQMVADIICQKITEGEKITKICGSPGFPNYSTYSKWKRDNPDFAKAVGQAYADRAERMTEEILQFADEAADSEDAAAARVKIEARKFILGADAPDKYGSKTKVVGDATQPLQILVSTGIVRPGDPGFGGGK